MNHIREITNGVIRHRADCPGCTSHRTRVRQCDYVRHGDCPAYWVICACGHAAEYADEPTARHYAAKHETEAR